MPAEAFVLDRDAGRTARHIAGKNPEEFAALSVKVNACAHVSSATKLLRLSSDPHPACAPGGAVGRRARHRWRPGESRHARRKLVGLEGS